MDAVQMKPDDDDADKQIKIDKNADLAPLLQQVFTSELGSKIYKNLKSPLYKLIKKGAGNDFKSCDINSAVKFLVLATEGDYTAKGILIQILQNPTKTAGDARERLFEYENYIEFLSNRVHEIDLEEAAMDTNLIAGPPKYDHKNNNNKKRAYEKK